MKKSKTAVGSAILVIIMVFSSKILGFLRQVVIASSYGTDLNTDIYFMSSDFIIGVSGAILAALSTALLTVYIDLFIKSGKKSANDLATKATSFFIISSIFIVLLFCILAPFIAKLLAPSYENFAHLRLVLYIRLFSPILIFTALQSVFAAVLNSNNSFAPGKLYGMVYNPIAIVLVLLFSSKFGTLPLIVAYFLANIIQTFIMGFYARKDFLAKFTFKFYDSNIKKVILLSLPLILSNFFIQVNGIVDKSVCSFLGEGYASNYSYAYTLEQFVTAIFTATASLVLLPKYAKDVSSENTQGVIKTFKTSLEGLILLLAPISVIACFLSKDIVNIVYLRGEFTNTAAINTTNALIGFCVGFCLVAVREMYIRLHFSYQNTKMPLIANILASILNLFLSLLFAKYLGILGVTLATSLSSILAIVILNRSSKKYISDFKFKTLTKLILKIIASCGVSLIVTLLCSKISIDNTIISFLIKAMVFVIIYIVMLLILKCSELLKLINYGKTQIKDRFIK